MNHKDLTKIKKELTDPTTAGKYAGKKHVEIKDILRSTPGKVPRESIDTGLLRAAVVKEDFAKLKAADLDYWLMLIGGDSLPLTDTAKAGVLSVFEAGSATQTAIEALMVRDTNLAEELGWPGITESDVADILREESPQPIKGKDK